MNNKEIKFESICKDFFEWPDRWEMVEEDVEYGKKMLPPMKSFIEFLIEKGFTKKTIKKHIDNLWLLGGELISRINMDEELREVSPVDLIKQNIGSDGGPYSQHLDSEAQFDSFDATCRKFHKFLKTT